MSLPASGKEAFDLLAKKAEEGDFSWMIEPLDWVILQALPDEGTNVGGLYQLGTSVGDMRSRPPFDAMTAGQVSGRIRAMYAAGMVRQVQMVGGRGKTAWQKTTFGKEKLEAWLLTQSA